jgi:hypothetical protein
MRLIAGKNNCRRLNIGENFLFVIEHEHRWKKKRRN